MCRVLLVDDHIPTRQALRDILSSTGDVQVIGEAGDGKQAVEMAAQCQPDVVLLDFSMPLMNGIEAARVIKQSRKDTIIIGLCALDDAYTAGVFMQAGAVTVLLKDSLSSLHSAVKHACKRRAQVFDDPG